MSLASHLLKYYTISLAANIPWNSVSISSNAVLKPIHVPADAGAAAVEFNVSHQARLVAIVACLGSPGVKVGVDVVCVHERDEYSVINKEGFDAWVGMYADVFSVGELNDMKSDVPHLGPRHDSTDLADHGQPLSRDSPHLVEARIRRFYASWALKEAYFKMTGEALLSKDLQQLEFRGVRSPAPDGGGGWGEIMRDVEIWYYNERVRNVTMELQAFEADYMIATAVCLDTDQAPGKGDTEERAGREVLDGVLPPFKSLDPEIDILPHAKLGVR